MRCARCQGLVVPDLFYDLLDDSGHLALSAWRCVCCGNIVDPIILENRLRSQASLLTGKESRPINSVPMVAGALSPCAHLPDYHRKMRDRQTG